MRLKGLTEWIHQLVTESDYEVVKEIQLGETTVRLSTAKDANFHNNLVQLVGNNGVVALSKKDVRALLSHIKVLMGYSYMARRDEGKLTEGISVADTRFVGKFVIHILSSGSEMRSAILSKKNNSKYATKDKKDLKTLWDLAGKYKGKEIKEGKLTESQQVAKTILQQLGGNKFIAMTGAKNFGSSKNSLQFKIGKNSKSISHVIITLKSSDLYDVEFIKLRGPSRKVVKKVSGVYNDMLGKIFTKYTGMRTSL